MRRELAIAVACGLLAGCGLLAPEREDPAPVREDPAPVREDPVVPQVERPRPASDSDRLLGYFQHIRKLPATELGKEHDLARQAYTLARSDFNRVRLAMLLSLPGTAHSDEPRALDLLDPIAKNPAGELHGLALLLATNLQERKRLDASAQGLQQKLDALRTLERSMIERRKK
jgi:hypothetical protein